MKDLNGFNPLHVACRFGRTEVLGFLLGSAVDVSAEVAVSKDTALHIAAENGFVDCCRLLLLYGASPHVTNSKGRTPIEAAAAVQPSTADVQSVINFLDQEELRAKKAKKASPKDRASPSSTHSGAHHVFELTRLFLFLSCTRFSVSPQEAVLGTKS